MKKPFHHYAKVSTFQNARALKQTLTPAEEILWKALRGRKLKGFKFRRQHPIASYVLDFYCHEKKLCVEVDGGIHQLKEYKENDKERTEVMESLEIKVIRFTNHQVISDLKRVLLEIAKRL
jgi:very-short-patch-repair endonuclease